MSQEQILSRIFIQAYNWLVDEGIVYPLYSKSLIEFAQKIGLENYQNIHEFTARTKFPTISIIKKMCEEYDLNEETICSKLPNIFEGVNQIMGNMIQIKGLEFFCGDGELLQEKKDRRYNDPNFKGIHYVAKATNNSMEPTIYPSQILYLKPVEKPDYLRKNELCAIIYNNKPTVKRLKDKIYDKETEDLIELVLVSDNIIGYPKELTIKASQISWQFVVKLHPDLE